MKVGTKVIHQVKFRHQLSKLKQNVKMIPGIFKFVGKFNTATIVTQKTQRVLPKTCLITFFLQIFGQFHKCNTCRERKKRFEFMKRYFWEEKVLLIFLLQTERL